MQQSDYNNQKKFNQLHGSAEKEMLEPGNKLHNLIDEDVSIMDNQSYCPQLVNQQHRKLIQMNDDIKVNFDRKNHTGVN